MAKKQRINNFDENEEESNPIEVASPSMDNVVEKKRKEGNWIKATASEVASYEASGKLKGYDPSTGEVLLK